MAENKNSVKLTDGNTLETQSSLCSRNHQPSSFLVILSRGVCFAFVHLDSCELIFTLESKHNLEAAHRISKRKPDYRWVSRRRDHHMTCSALS